MVRAALAIVLLMLAAPAAAREPLVRVPFVGCPSDGQQGPQPAPKNGTTPRIQARIAAKLAFYSMGEIGVLAPRGWHCLGLSGSNGSILIVTPTKHRPDDFLNDRPRSLHGPVIQADLSYGGTSGRYAVAKAVARYFPGHYKFVRDVIKMDRDIGARSIEPLPRNPYSTDVIGRRTATSLRFMTPAHHKGEGTDSWLAPDQHPIEGIRVLLKGFDGPDLYGVDVRLPPRLRGLTEVILSSAKGSN